MIHDVKIYENNLTFTCKLGSISFASNKSIGLNPIVESIRKMCVCVFFFCLYVRTNKNRCIEFNYQINDG